MLCKSPTGKGGWGRRPLEVSRAGGHGARRVRAGWPSVVAVRRNAQRHGGLRAYASPYPERAIIHSELVDEWLVVGWWCCVLSCCKAKIRVLSWLIESFALPAGAGPHHTAAQWRPLPDLTFLVTDDPAEAAERAGQRDGRPFSAEYRHVHHRAAALYDQATTHAPGNIVVIDRRQLATSGAVSLMRTRITECQQALAVR
jgi:hypothetical protein